MATDKMNQTRFNKNVQERKITDEHHIPLGYQNHREGTNEEEHLTRSEDGEELKIQK